MIREIKIKIQDVRVQRYKEGYLMLNSSRGSKIVRAFKFFGKMWITKDVKRRKKYSFDDDGWAYLKISGWDKFCRICTLEYKIAKDCKKSLAANV